MASTAEIVIRLAKVVESALDGLGLTPNQYRALALIEAGAPPMREFAVRLAMHPPNVSTLIDGLANRGLVTRQRDSDDKRRVLLQLTRTGRKLLDDAEARAANALHVVAAFDGPRHRTLLTALDNWRVALDRVADDLHRRMDQPPARVRPHA